MVINNPKVIRINSEKTIVILGGGTGGLVTANILRKKLKKNHRIILIDKEEYHFFPPSYLWVMMGWRKIDKVKKSLERLNRKRIEFIQAEVKKIDLQNKQVVLKSEADSILYDYLILALGAELDLTSLPFDSEDVHLFYSFAGLEPLKKRLETFTQGVVTLVIASLPYKCPAAPYEAALFLRNYFNKKNRNQIEINLYAPEPAPLPVAGPDVGLAVTQMFEDFKINYYPNSQFKNIIPEKKTIHFVDGSSQDYDLCLVVPPHKAPNIVGEAGLTDDSGWIPSDRSTLKTQYSNVYAIGDVTSIKLPNGGILPKAGIFAHKHAEVVAENISAEILDHPKRIKYEGNGSCFIEIGNGKAGYASGNFYKTPKPEVKVYKPRRYWHWSKVIFEKYWFRKWF
ncbi:MAG: Sulfide dehydrogenase [flavocytochrome c] flavoprotein chain precursor [Candidatus Heimdallarchaeota archaeon LC_3]|nr:MAG: Sulfide dehydrogenase [flavocytochrome c] flavoprotein chain precursor [Candidatus Heimdallarchaeota archaeon LC_3]OLS26534.1 MAG: Sulfide dehydrogenase [flavocytochrome c] flavoprotein chain precursor [Candidatus Heimdallarchaeota archaeon LC_3]